MANEDFEQILRLITEARNRVYSKANSELVLLYFNVGKVVFEKISQGYWGQSTVQELSNFILSKFPNLTGFNRRGLYRMKQFYETYSSHEFVSTLATQLEAYFSGNQDNAKVSAMQTQLNRIDLLKEKLMSSLLTQISWTNHRLILSKTKSAEDKFYYLITTIRERYSSRDLERSLNSAQFERVMLSNPIVSAVRTQLPENLFKDPYVFEFLDLPEGHSENDLEKALIHNLQKFILEIGKGFTYMGNQFRLQVGNKD